MNSYKYKPSSVMFDERLKSTLAKIQSDYNRGKIMTKSEYAYKIQEAVNSFFLKMGKPTFEFIEASDVPSFIHYKEMVESSKNDMESIINGCENLNQILSDMNSSMIEETSIINNSLIMIDNKVSKIEKKLKSISEASSMIFSDSFDEGYNYSWSDSSYGDDRLSRVSTESGVCSLYESTKTQERNFTVSILNSSNGFPGNTHEVYETPHGVKYVGETNSTMELSNSTNEDANSLFEFEMYKLDDDTLANTSSIGYTYKEGISWICDEDSLRLDLKIDFKTPTRLNAIILNGAAKINSQTDNPIISEIIIKDDYATFQTIRYGKELLEKTVINFKPQVVKEVIIKIVQVDSVPTKVARNFALSVDPNKMPYFLSDFKDFTQIDKPTISIEDLGLIYDTKDKSIIYPSTESENTFMKKEYRKSKLFYSNVNADSEDKIFTEVITANRYKIGISYIGFEYREYLDNGIYVSASFDAEKPIKRVTLNAIDKVPTSFNNAEQDKEKKKPFIGYYLSFNEEEEWHQIYPRTNHKSGQCSIYINSELNIESRNPNVTYIDRLVDATKVRIKIELRRPENIIDETPIVSEYNLDIDGE